MGSAISCGWRSADAISVMVGFSAIRGDEQAMPGVEKSNPKFGPIGKGH
jgi:hypothetical protein